MYDLIIRNGLVYDGTGAAVHEGIKWQGESFPQYMDALEKLPLAIDVGTQVPHAAVRAYVMGERGPAHEVAIEQEVNGASLGPADVHNCRAAGR